MLLLHFNTSNVTIQLQTLNTSSTNINNFNTSNVTIQPTYEWCSNACYIISIHLMLLFNEDSHLEWGEMPVFQYI